jgi:hypothetical protein
MGVVPDELRAPIRELLAALVRGDMPNQLTWVRNYGSGGTRLVAQPEAIWTHRFTDVVRRDDGGWHVVLPLWTVDESPSDLSAEVGVGSDGTAEILGVHVL